VRAGTQGLERIRTFVTTAYCRGKQTFSLGIFPRTFHRGQFCRGHSPHTFLESPSQLGGGIVFAGNRHSSLAFPSLGHFTLGNFAWRFPLHFLEPPHLAGSTVSLETDVPWTFFFRHIITLDNFPMDIPLTFLEPPSHCAEVLYSRETDIPLGHSPYRYFTLSNFPLDIPPFLAFWTFSVWLLVADA